MKILCLFILLSLSSKLFAGCGVYIPKKMFNHDGYVIHFNFTKLLDEKKYNEVDQLSKAHFVLNIEGIEQTGRFHRAVGVITMGPYHVRESVLCLTQICAVSDYRKAFVKSFKKLKVLLPTCSQAEKKGPMEMGPYRTRKNIELFYRLLIP